MKIVIIGGTGLIGTKVAFKLKKLGHNVIVASPSTGINTLTKEGLDDALKGADVVVDVANSPSFEDKAVMDFFKTSSNNLLASEKKAGVKHHIALSVVGTDRLQESGYFRAKQVQENMIKQAGIPYSIIQATQFFEFVGSIAQSGDVNGTIHMPSALIQPISSEDVATAVADVALGAPLNKTIEVAGPEKFQLDDLVRKYMNQNKDPRKVVTDPNATYYGIKLNDQSITPGKNPRLGKIRYDEWISRQDN